MGKGEAEMKRLIALLLCALLLTGCTGGDVSRVDRVVGESELYTELEIKRAMNKVMGFFKAEFDGCTLTELRYDEEKVAERQRAWKEDYGSEAIILFATFDVDETGGDGSLEPNSTYTRYKWLLTKTMFGWEIRDWGYG